MSTFNCICGKVTRQAEEPREASSILYSLADFQDLEGRVADSIESYLQASDKSSWVSNYFHPNYPSDFPQREVIEDVISREANLSFTSVFQCPACGCVAMAKSDAENWLFFKPIQKFND